MIESCHDMTVIFFIEELHDVIFVIEDLHEEIVGDCDRWPT